MDKPVPVGNWVWLDTRPRLWWVGPRQAFLPEAGTQPCSATRSEGILLVLREEGCGHPGAGGLSPVEANCLLLPGMLLSEESSGRRASGLCALVWLLLLLGGRAVLYTLVFSRGSLLLPQRSVISSSSYLNGGVWGRTKGQLRTEAPSTPLGEEGSLLLLKLDPDSPCSSIRRRRSPAASSGAVPGMQTAADLL